MAEIRNPGILIRDVETKNIMTESALPVGGAIGTVERQRRSRKK